MMTWGQTSTTNPAGACASTGFGAAVAPVGVASNQAREDEPGGYPRSPETATTWQPVVRWSETEADSTSMKAVIDVARAYEARGFSPRLNFTRALETGRIVALEIAVEQKPRLAVAAAAAEAERAAQAHATAEQWGGA